MPAAWALGQKVGTHGSAARASDSSASPKKRVAAREVAALRQIFTMRAFLLSRRPK